jgi:membrane-associated phospholipid phosphatase
MDYIYVLFFSGFLLPNFSIKEAILLLLMCCLIFFYINKELKRIFNEKNITLFGQVDRPNGKKLGMPSGHSQLATFVFLYICLKYKKINYLFLFIYLSILLQRIVSNKHTVNQVIVGGVFGWITLVVFQCFQNNLV